MHSPYFLKENTDPNEPFCCSGTMKHPRQAYRFVLVVGRTLLEALMVFFIVTILPRRMSDYALFSSVAFALLRLDAVFSDYFSIKSGAFTERVSLAFGKAKCGDLIITVFPEKLDAALPKKLVLVFPAKHIKSIDINEDRLTIRGTFHIFAADAYGTAPQEMSVYSPAGFTHKWMGNFKNEWTLQLDPEQEDSIRNKIKEITEG